MTAPKMDELFFVPINVDRASASFEQIENAIICFFERRWASCITLALAAELMLPECPAGKDVFAETRDGLIRLGHDKTVAADWLNKPRNWLKHNLPDDKLELIALDCIFAIIRGLSRVYYNTGLHSRVTNKFDDWMAVYSTSKFSN